jgi:hypothetical protein
VARHPTLDPPDRTRSRRRAACALLGLLALAVGAGAGCGDASVGVRLVFPSERAFLASALARIDVYDGGGSGATSPDAICRSLSVNPPTPPAGVKPIATSGLADACDFANGSVTIDGVGVGRRVFFVETVDHDSTTIVRGCKVVDLAAEPSASANDDLVAVVDVQLATLPTFPTAPPSCTTLDEKCKEKVECKPES